MFLKQISLFFVISSIFLSQILTASGTSSSKKKIKKAVKKISAVNQFKKEGKKLLEEFKKSLYEKKDKNGNTLLFYIKSFTKSSGGKLNFDKKKNPGYSEVLENFYNSYRRLWVKIHGLPKVNGTSIGRQQGAFEKVSFSFEIERAVRSRLSNVSLDSQAKLEFWNYFFLPDWNSLQILIEGKKKPELIISLIEENRLQWLKWLKDSSKTKGFEPQKKKYTYSNESKEKYGLSHTGSYVIDIMKKVSINNKYDNLFFQFLPLKKEYITWGEIHSSRKRFEWLLTPNNKKIKYPQSVTDLYQSNLKKLSDVMLELAAYFNKSKKYKLANNDNLMKLFGALQIHEVFRLSSEEVIKRLVDITEIWNLERYFRTLLRKSPSILSASYVSGSPWARGYTEMLTGENREGYRDIFLERSMSTDATIFKFHYVGFRRKYRDEQTKVKGIDPNLYGLEFRTGGYGPRGLALQALATVEMMKMKSSDFNKIIPDFDQASYDSIKSQVQKKWGSCGSYVCSQVESQSISQEMLDYLKETFINSYYEIAFRKWEDKFKPALKGDIVDLRDKVSSCLGFSPRKKSKRLGVEKNIAGIFESDKNKVESFRKKITNGWGKVIKKSPDLTNKYYSLLCMRAWAHKFNQVIQSENNYFPLIGTTRKFTSAETKKYKAKESFVPTERGKSMNLNSFYNLVKPLKNPYKYQTLIYPNLPLTPPAKSS